MAGSVLIVPAADGEEDTGAEIYDPATQTFSRTGWGNRYSEVAATATLLTSGKVLVTLNPPECDILGTEAQSYDPAAGQFVAIHQADPRIPVEALSTQTAQIEREIPETLFARLCTAFAMLSLAIACVGLYGTTSYAVVRRTNEIGIRMALGAQRETIVWMVLREVLMLAIAGLAIGLPAALSASKLTQSLLFGVKPGDPWALAPALAILLSAALAAGYLPARKASKADPMAAVRHE